MPVLPLRPPKQWVGVEGYTCHTSNGRGWKPTPRGGGCCSQANAKMKGLNPEAPQRQTDWSGFPSGDRSASSSGLQLLQHQEILVSHPLIIIAPAAMLTPVSLQGVGTSRV